MPNRIGPAASVLAAVALLAASCGGNTETDTAPAVTTTAPPVATEAPAPTTAPVTTEAPTTTAPPAATEAPTTTAAPVTTEAPTTTAADGHGEHGEHDEHDGGPFDDGSPDEPCLRETLGDERFEQIAAGATPTNTDERAMGRCFNGDGDGDGPALPITEHPHPGTPELPPRYNVGEALTLGDPFAEQMTDFFHDAAAVADTRAWGANTWRLFVSYEVDTDGAIVWPRLDSIVDSIVAARQAGFAVAVTPGIVRGADLTGSPAEMLTQLHDQRLPAAVELAALAERLNVEFFSPAPEAEGLLHDRDFGDEYESTGAVYDSYDLHLEPTIDPSLKVRAPLISQWHEAWAPQLRELFSGEMVAHFGTSSPWYLVPSYDRIGITLDHFRLEPESFRNVVAADLANVVASAAASGIDWQVHETYFFFSEVADPGMSGNRPELAEPGSIGDWEDPDEVARLRDLQDDYFLIALEEYDTIGTGRGFDIGGWVMPGMEVAGSATADTIAEYFRSR